MVGQTWRGGSGKRVHVARLLRACEIAALDETLGRRSGALLAASGTSDVSDAVVLIATDGDSIITSDVRDLEPLAALVGLQVDLVPV